MNNINQTHFGSGDNIGEDKVNVEKSKSENKFFPIWAQWVSWILGIILAILAIYPYFIKI